MSGFEHPQAPGRCVGLWPGEALTRRQADPRRVQGRGAGGGVTSKSESSGISSGETIRFSSIER